MVFVLPPAAAYRELDDRVKKQPGHFVQSQSGTRQRACRRSAQRLAANRRISRPVQNQSRTAIQPGMISLPAIEVMPVVLGDVVDHQVTGKFFIIEIATQVVR